MRSTLARLDRRTGSVVAMKLFTTLATEEMFDVLELSPLAVERDSRIARGWFARVPSDGIGADGFARRIFGVDGFRFAAP